MWRARRGRGCGVFVGHARRSEGDDVTGAAAQCVGNVTFRWARGTAVQRRLVLWRFVGKI